MSSSRSLSPAPPDAALEALAGSTEPFLIGVRHHSPALSVVIGELLDRFRPEVLLLELPAEFAPWLPWLADPATAAPVALAGVLGADGAPAFYPFADFSPELVALRWAARNGVEVIPCDLPLSSRFWHDREQTAPDAAGPRDSGTSGTSRSPFGDALRQAATGRPDEDMWDRVVEARAPGADPEAVRRAALLVGWAMRTDAATGAGVGALDLRREAWMRRCLASVAGRRAVAVVGSFHAAALLAGDATTDGAQPAPDGIVGSLHAAPLLAGDATTDGTQPAPDGIVGSLHAAALVAGDGAEPASDGVVTSLVPYSFALLDSRSGYPAGIRDPRWQQAVVAARGRAGEVEAAALAAVVEVCSRVRGAGHPAGPAEAREVFRLAADLARLRGLPAPGRGELVEGLQSVLAHGEVLGRGRAVAAAMEAVLVGDVRGSLAPGAPRSGLRPAVEALLAELRLPGPGGQAKDLRLDPLRSELDRRRDVALRQLSACRIPYAENTAVEGTAGVDALTTRWNVEWTPGTEAMLDVAGIRGVTLAQAAEGALRERRRREEGDEGPTAAQIIAGLEAAAACGLAGLATQRLEELAEQVPASATLEELMAALALVDRLRSGHIPGLPAAVAGGLADLAGLSEVLEAAAVRQVDGLAGSEDLDDVRALVALGRRADAAGVGLRLADALVRLTDGGTPVMAAGAGAVQVLLGLAEPAELGTRVGSWVDAAVSDEARRRLLGHLRGLLAAAEPLLQSGPDALDALLDRVATLPDEAFLARLPALRGGFQTVSPAGRDRLLAVVRDRLGDGHTADLGDTDSAALLWRLLADRAGRAAADALGLLPDTATEPSTVDENESAVETKVETGGRELAVLDRWRLLLGRQDQQLGGAARRYATALDELYGNGRGEGSAADAAGRAGRGAPFPGVREWAEELSALFGPGIREEVLARAAEGGRRDAVLLLDPEAVNPSVELLQTVLSLAGGMPESSLSKLRPLVARIVDELTRRLATRLRPALAGISTPRPTYRPGGPLDLPRTLRANLATTRRGEDGRVQVIPERPVFRTRARRGVDWRLVLVVDVSGSMEASIIWSALTGAILAGVPALSTHFVAFSTEVVDLTDRVSDPLSLLLEVQVGGGTHIAKGLRHARSLVTVPSRTLVVLVSDFEEGYPIGGLLAEARALVESGVTVLGCASLDDAGRPRYSVPVASQLVAAGMPVAALSPLELARWVAEKVKP
ncbi:vWA domain-containing protein [Dactylosporangium sp. CA-233914]|uniref:vWA domain-containing protein n=1 Tax=Dactylosporangium sp. CA-233914 TaxID=3239934 RepID=UPI003D8F24CD